VHRKERLRHGFLHNAMNGAESEKRRGWVAIAAAAILIVLTLAIWFYVDRAFVDRGVLERGAATAQFVGRLNVAFALVLISGVLGIVSGVVQARSGLRNRPLTFALVVAFASGLLIAVFASGSAP
jgi:hypothetical protein